MGILVAITLILMVLKCLAIAPVVTMSWWLVFTPVLFIIGAALVFGVLAALFATIVTIVDRIPVKGKK